MIPFDEETMMVMLELPDMPKMDKRHLEKGPMEGMQGSDAEKLLCDIYCMLKKHFGEKPEENSFGEKREGMNKTGKEVMEDEL